MAIDQLEYLVGNDTGIADEKWRVKIPSKIYGGNDSSVYLRFLDEDSIDIIPESYFDETLFDEYLEGEVSENERENFFDSLYRVNLDDKGRILIPSDLRNLTNFGKEVYFIGMKDSIRMKSKR